MRALHLPFDHHNPYQTALASALRATGVEVKHARLGWRIWKSARRAEVVHIHWTHALARAAGWKFLLGFPFLVAQLLALRLTKRRIIWTAHNLSNHEQRHRLRDWLTAATVGHLAHAVIVHGDSAQRALVRRFGISQRKTAVIPHGHYIGYYPDEVGRKEARRHLRLPGRARVILFLGHIRPYKGVEELIASFRSIKSEESMLLLAGRPADRALESRLRSLADGDAVRFEPGFVPNEQIQIFMNAADAVVLPYRDVLTSGAVVLAMSFGKACIAPRLGCIVDTLDERGAFLYDPSDRRGLESALRAALAADDQLSAMGRHNFGKASRRSWEQIAAVTAQLYRGHAPEAAAIFRECYGSSA